MPVKKKVAPVSKKKSRVLAIREEIAEENICGGIKKDGELCRRYAGWGTDHPGFGPCKFHAHEGALAQVPGATRYGNYVRASDMYLELVNDPEIKRLDEEIALVRYRLADVEATIEDVRSRNGGFRMPDDNKESQIVLQLMRQAGTLAETVGKLVDRKHKIEEGKIVTFRQVQEVLGQVVYVVKKHVTDEVVLNRIAEDFRRIDVSKFEP